MKQAWKFLIVGAIFILIATPLQPIHAQSLPPVGPVEGSIPSVPPEIESTNTFDASTLAVGKLPPLKALLVLGPLTPVEDFNAQKAIMDATADKLTSYGIQVVKSYAPNNNWNNIIAEAATSQFFIYRGHGIYSWNNDPNSVGGMKIQDGDMPIYVSPDMIRNDFRLAPNGLVFLYGCFTAGSSGGETDISRETALDRVTQYADPFLDAGAAGYYASWKPTAFEDIIGLLLNGKTLEEAYTSYSDFNNDGYAYSTTNSTHSDDRLWLDADNYPPLYYDYAFTGKPTATLSTLFSPTMVVTSPGLTLIADPSTPARTYTVTIDSNSQQSFNWTAALANKSSSGNWVSLSPANSTSGQTLTVTLVPPSTLGTYTATLRITASSPTYDVINPVQDFPIKIIVVSEVKEVFIPLIER